MRGRKRRRKRWTSDDLRDYSANDGLRSLVLVTLTMPRPYFRPSRLLRRRRRRRRQISGDDLLTKCSCSFSKHQCANALIRKIHDIVFIFGLYIKCLWNLIRGDVMLGLEYVSTMVGSMEMSMVMSRYARMPGCLPGRAITTTRLELQARV